MTLYYHQCNKRHLGDIMTYGLRERTFVSTQSWWWDRYNLLEASRKSSSVSQYSKERRAFGASACLVMDLEPEEVFHMPRFWVFSDREAPDRYRLRRTVAPERLRVLPRRLTTRTMLKELGLL